MTCLRMTWREHALYSHCETTGRRWRNCHPGRPAFRPSTWIVRRRSGRKSHFGSSAHYLPLFGNNRAWGSRSYSATFQRTVVSHTVAICRPSARACVAKTLLLINRASVDGESAVVLRSQPQDSSSWRVTVYFRMEKLLVLRAVHESETAPT